MTISKKIKKIIKLITPPIAIDLVESSLGKRNIYSGMFSNWSEATIRTKGYESENILEHVVAATQKVIDGKFAFERDSVTFDKIVYSWPITSGLMLNAAKNDGIINVIDFGGALGSSYIQNKKFLDRVDLKSWSIVEQKNYVAAGREIIKDKKIAFYESLEECLQQKNPTVILVSSTLQYVEYPYRLLEKLAETTATHLLIDRTPLSRSHIDHITTQKVPKKIYSASYPMWIFSEEALLKRLSNDWTIIEVFNSNDGAAKTEQGLDFIFKGLILERKKCL